MSYKKPGLIIFCAWFQFIIAAFTGLSVIGLFNVANPSNAVAPIAVVMTTLFYLMVGSGIGLLKRQKWAKTIAIILFSLFVLSGLYSLSQPKPEVTGKSAAYQLGYNGGQFLVYGGSGLGLYALTLNKSVKRYFDRDVDDRDTDKTA